MPKKLDDCVKDVKSQGHDDDSAWAICKSSTGETLSEAIMREAISSKLRGCGCKKKTY